MNFPSAGKVASLRYAIPVLVTVFVVQDSGLESLFAQELPREISYGLSAVELKQKAAEYAQKKFMPIDLSTHYVKRGVIAIGAIWEHSPTADFKLRAGLLREDMKQAIVIFGQDSYRLIHFTGTGQGAEERYSGIWLKGKPQRIYIRYGVPLKELKKLNEKFALDGHSILRLATFTENRAPLFTAVWDEPIVTTRIFDHDLSLTRFRKSIEQRTKDGFRLVQAIPFLKKKKFYFSAIWEPSRGKKQEIMTNITRLQISKMGQNKKERHFRPQSIAAYRLGIKDRHVMIWEEHTVPSVTKKKTTSNKTKKTDKKRKPLFPIKR